MCLRLCFGPGEDQFRAIAIIMVTIWGLYIGNAIMSSETMGCEFETEAEIDADGESSDADLAAGGVD